MNRPQDLKDVIALILSQLPRAKKATGNGETHSDGFYYMS